MKTKEELVNTYIKYSSDITEEIFNKIIDKLESLGFKKYSTGSRNKEYIHFINTFPQLKIYNNYWFVTTSINGNYKEIQVSDILGKESHFEVGKWYEIIAANYKPGEHISKFLKLKDGNFYYSETIRFGNYRKLSYWHGYANWVREVSLEEIQKYLPEGHVDKIVKEFVLPRKWCVKFDKNNWKTLADWANFDWYKEYKTDHTYYLTVNKTHFGILSNDYTEITFEQFKQYVLKESVKEEVKPLSVDDLVEGEIYLIEYPSGNQFINLSNGKDDVKCYIDIRNKEYHKSSTCGGAINCTIASPEEKKWLLTCIKQDEFISPDQLDMYDSEGNLIEDKPKFKIGDWVVVIPSNNYFPNYTNAIGHIFPIRDDSAYYQSFIKGNPSAIDPNNTYGINYTLEDVRIATPEEIAKVTKPEPKESKEFDRNWYVEVSSQEEADKVFEYLKSIGESVVSNEFSNRKYIPKRDHKYIYYLTGAEQWFLGTNPRNYPQKQLSDILPNYSPESKVNRNVYYEVSNQEEYEEILDWLESNGEKVDRGFCVNNIWNFVYYHKDSKDWYLGDVKPNLPKAEFPFKSKQSIKVNTYFEEACPFPSFGEFNANIGNGISMVDKRRGYSTTKLEQISKPIPEIEIVTNRFKAQPIKKRILPEIY